MALLLEQAAIHDQGIPVPRVRAPAALDYVTAHAGASKHVLHLSPQHLGARLDPQRFLRIHRTHIVNLDQVKAFRRQGKGRLAAVLADGTRLPVSRSRSQDLRRLGA